jgi:TIR domain
MTRPLIFLSYRHGPKWTKLANGLHLKLEAIAEGVGFDTFLDSEEIRAGGNWQQQVDAALEQCTHFVALLCDEYWVKSNQCLRELYRAVERFEAGGGSPKLLFVLANEMRPDLLKLDGARARGALNSPDPQLKALGDVNFLGPFDANYRLESLAWDNPKKLDKQYAQLVERLLKSGGLGQG